MPHGSFHRNIEAQLERWKDSPSRQPLLLNGSNHGEDWHEHRVCSKQIYGRQGRTRLGSEILYQYTDKIIRKNIREGHILP